MKRTRRFTAALTALLMTMLTAPLAADAVSQRPIINADSDAFTITDSILTVSEPVDVFTEAQEQGIYVVVVRLGIPREYDEQYFWVLPINRDGTIHLGDPSERILYYTELRDTLRDPELTMLREDAFTVGDVFYLERWGKVLMWPGEYLPDFAPSGKEWEGSLDPRISRIHYKGNLIDMLGEDLREPLRQAAAYSIRLFDGYVDPEQFTIGDTTDDGTIDILDCIALNKSLIGGLDLTNCGYAAADVDGDHTITTTDALCLLRKIVHLE